MSNWYDDIGDGYPTYNDYGGGTYSYNTTGAGFAGGAYSPSYDYSGSPGYQYWTNYQNPYGTEAVTAYAGGSPYGGGGGTQSYATTGAGFYNSPYDYGGGGAYGTEAVTATGTPFDYQIQETNIGTAQYGFFENIANSPPPYVTPPGTTETVTSHTTPPPPNTVHTTPITPPPFTPPATTPPYVTPPQTTPPYYPTEEVVSEAAKIKPVQHQVEAVAIANDPWNFDWAPYAPGGDLFPWLSPVTDPKKKAAAQNPSSPKGSGGGASGGGGSSSKPQQQPPNTGGPLTAQQIAQIKAALGLNPQPAAPGTVTPQQRNALAALTPAQLQQLLNDPNLTPAQRQAILDALRQANARQLLTARRPATAAVNSGGAGGAVPGAAAAKPGAAGASPLQPASLLMPALVVAGVAAAWGVTHHHQVAPAVRSAARRVRRVFA